MELKEEWRKARARLAERERALERLGRIGLDGIRAKRASGAFKRPARGPARGRNPGETGTVAEATVSPENSPTKAE